MATGAYWPAHEDYLGVESNTGGTIDATGEKVALIGRVWNEDGTTKSIRKVGIRFGSVTKAGGSALTLSLQDVDLTAGPVFRPDGTQDQTVAIPNASITANTFLLSGALSADRSVAFGEMVAVVVEFDGSGRLGADSFRIDSINVLSHGYSSASMALFTSSWSEVSCLPTVLFEFSDGTYGSFDGGVVINSGGTLQHNSGSTPDEVALKFNAPFDCVCDGGWIRTWKDANHDIVLYQGTTQIAIASVDANAVSGTYVQTHYFTFPAVSLTMAGGPYYLAHKPGGSNTRVFYADVDNSAYWAAMPGGTDVTYASRTDGGAWTETATRRLAAGVRLYPNISGGSGGLLVHPGMRGGFA